MSQWRGRIFLDAGLILYVGPGSTADRHSHQAVQLVWSLDAPFEVELEGDRMARRAVLIPADATHTLDAAGETIVLLLVESHGARGAALDREARRDIGRDVSDALSGITFLAQNVGHVDIAAWCDAVLSALGVTATSPAISSVTRRAIAYIEQAIDGVPRVSDVASALHLSPTRITHLFSKEVGVPFRRFVLWTRIKRAVAAFQAGNDLSTSAIAAGFSDSAHFSRTFRALFGLSPSLVLPIAELTGTIWSEPSG